MYVNLCVWAQTQPEKNISTWRIIKINKSKHTSDTGEMIWNPRKIATAEKINKIKYERATERQVSKENVPIKIRQKMRYTYLTVRFILYFPWCITVFNGIQFFCALAFVLRILLLYQIMCVWVRVWSCLSSKRCCFLWPDKIK